MTGITSWRPGALLKELGRSEGIGSLRRGGVAVYLLHHRQLRDDSVRDGCEALLSESEWARYRKLAGAVARDEFLLSRAALRLLLTALNPRIGPGDWLLRYNPGVRPVVSSEQDAEAPAFSISHSKGLVAVALCRGAAPGVDVEARSRKVDALAIAERYFSSSEARWLKSMPEKERPDAFMALWTLKEASAKADGKGLAGGLGRREFRFTDDDRIVAGHDAEGGRQYWLFHLPDEGQLAVALRHSGAGGPVPCIALKLSLHSARSSAVKPVLRASSAITV